LENHVATTTDFINAYRQKRTEYDRGNDFWQFSAYLSLVSWKKTFRRLKNWTSRGFIHALVSVPLQQLEARGAAPRNSSSKHSNRSLHFEVAKLHQTEGAVAYLIGLISPIASFAQLRPSNLDGLKQALEAEKENDYSSTHSAYNGKSAIQFQCLLIALFIAYMTALKDRDKIHQEEGEILESEMATAKLKSVKNKGQWAMQSMMKKVKENTKMMERKLDSQTRIWNYGRILWTVTSSQMFDDHLQSLQGALVSVRPGEEAHAWFFQLMELDEEPGSDGDGDDEDKDGDDEDKDGDDEDEGRTEDDEDGDGTEDVDEEQRREITLATSDADPVNRFKNWTRLITSYFGALHHVKSTVTDHPHEFQGKFIVARRRSSPVPRKLNWPDVIRNLCKEDGEVQPLSNTTSFGDAITNNSILRPISSKDSEPLSPEAHFTPKQADEAISVLQKSINRDRKSFASFGTSSAALDIHFSMEEASSALVDSAMLSKKKKKKKKVIETEMVLWSADEHCEAIATAILRYSDKAIFDDQQDLRELILVRTIFTSTHSLG
jgi:hypothetical protein